MHRLLPALLLIFAAAAQAATIPRAAQRYRGNLTRVARYVWGLDAPVADFGAQIHQESRWRQGARSAYAEGLAQFTPATATWISGTYRVGRADPYNPSWALRALVTYDRHLWRRVKAADGCERMAFALSAYNGGLGWVYRDKRLAKKGGLDPLIWFGSVATVNAGRSQANWRENRGYPRLILHRWAPLYAAAGWGERSCP